MAELLIGFGIGVVVGGFLLKRFPNIFKGSIKGTPGGGGGTQPK